jgi:hypothetical protein
MTSSNALKLSKEYLAGFIDGEGYITYNHFTDEKSKNWRRFNVVITNTDKKILTLIQKEYKGVLTLNNNHLKGWAECWMLRMCKKDGEKFLSDIEPYLIIKKEKAKEFLILCKK